MSFSNTSMRRVVANKPHIALIDGWWRVSAIRLRGETFARVPTGAPQTAHDRWNAAHRFIQPLNHALHWCPTCQQRVRR